MLDPFDARALTIAGHVRAYLHRRLREALALHERALSLNPNLAMAWALSGVAYAYLGDWEEAERRITRYKKLSPLDPHAFFYDTAFIIVALLKRDYESAVIAGRAVSEMNPILLGSLQAVSGSAGPSRPASRKPGWCAQRLLAMEPEFTIEHFLETTPLERDCRPRGLCRGAAAGRAAREAAHGRPGHGGKRADGRLGGRP